MITSIDFFHNMLEFDQKFKINLLIEILKEKVLFLYKVFIIIFLFF